MYREDGMNPAARWLFAAALVASTAACVTINIYFPAAAAEKAADGIIDVAGYLKQKVKGAVRPVSHYEELLISAARENKADGVICGHIHKAEIRDFGPIRYMNDGDWVDSCTALGAF